MSEEELREAALRIYLVLLLNPVWTREGPVKLADEAWNRARIFNAAETAR